MSHLQNKNLSKNFYFLNGMGNKEEEKEEMPRPSLMKQTDIAIEHLLQEKHLDIIEKKNCLGASLVFNEPIDYNKDFRNAANTIKINPGKKVVTPHFNNSWKGLVWFFLALAYLNYGKNLQKKYFDLIPYSYHKKSRKNFNLRYATRYIDIINRDTLDEYILEAHYAISADVVAYFTKDKAVQKQEQDDKMNELLTEKFKTLPLDDKIEEMSVAVAPVPVDRQKLYITKLHSDMGIYEPENIQSYINFFAELLNIDVELSTIKTDDTLHRVYKNFPATPVWSLNGFK